MFQYLIFILWVLIQTILLNWAIILVMNTYANIFGLLCFVLFIQTSLVIPVLSVVSNKKNENN